MAYKSVQNENSEKKLVLSIITVSYNSFEGLILTNSSLVNFKNCLIETILVDANSGDGTSEFIKSEKCIYDVIVQEKDNGIYDAMNKGISLSSGKYLLFLNCGDQLIQSLDMNNLLHIINGEEKIFIGSIRLTHENGAEITPPPFKVSKFLEQAWPHQAALIPRDYFYQIGNYSTAYKISADQEWFVRALKSQLPFERLNFPISVYEMGGISDRKESQKIIEKEKRTILIYHFGFLYYAIGTLKLIFQKILFSLLNYLKSGLKHFSKLLG